MTLPTLGHAQLDADHADILQCLEGLKNNSQNYMDTVFKFQEYLLSHTLREEAYMVHLGYPSMQEHLEAHGDLLAKSKYLMNGDPYILDDCAIVLIKHINQEDRKFAAWKAERDQITS
jgi:hemerythrin